MGRKQRGYKAEVSCTERENVNRVVKKIEHESNQPNGYSVDVVNSITNLHMVSIIITSIEAFLIWLFSQSTNLFLSRSDFQHKICYLSTLVNILH